MYIDGTVRAYVDESTAGTSTPGGGSISALAGALGMSMACMAANFTVGKKKYEKVWPRVSELLAVCDKARDELLQFTDDDVAAYSHVSAAYSMPKGTPEEKTARKKMK